MFILEIFSQTPMYVWYIFGIIMFPIIRFLKPKNRYLPFLAAIPLIISFFMNAEHDSLFFHVSNIDLFYYSMSVLLGATIGIALQLGIQRIPTQFYESKHSYLLFIGSFFMACFFGSLKATHFSLFSGFLMGQVFVHLYFYINNIKLYNK